jgi:murein DD-endopeptidase MepM/ murein hydrolase activator NlpD
VRRSTSRASARTSIRTDAIPCSTRSAPTAASITPRRPARVRAAGDGKVLFRGSQGGYGNTIILQHGSNITTLYGHLSRFGGFRVGARVNQGDIVGYVGQSGLATGPHLHYEYRVNGAHRNPRTVPLPPADPIPAARQTEFRAAAELLWRQLDEYAQRLPVTQPQHANLGPEVPPEIASSFD